VITSERPVADVQSRPDRRRIPIDQVGVSDLRYLVVVADRSERPQPTVARLRMSVSLPQEVKGTHMSRFIEVLNEFGPELHVDNIRQLLGNLATRLDSSCAHLDIEFPFFLQKPAPVTGAVGLMDYNVRFSATCENGKIDFIVTVIVPVTTLCPCSKAISAHGAHNQRGHVTFAIRFAHPIWIEDLVQLVESCASSELYSLLKRPDEKAVTERAYENPVFVEDLVRNIAVRAQAEPDILWYKVEAENFESIHNHNAYACVEQHK
jgi:GTP cyclohydrolase I